MSCFQIIRLSFLVVVWGFGGFLFVCFGFFSSKVGKLGFP